MNSTIAKPLEISGVGLHSGTKSRVRIFPANPGEGRYFVRVDLPEKPLIPVCVESVSQTILSTELANREARVRTVEHLLAALAGCGVDNVRIEIDAPEVPLLDGSAQIWVEALAQAGIIRDGEVENQSTVNSQQSTVKNSSLITDYCSLMTEKTPHPIWIREGDAFVAALPSSEMRFTYGIDFDYSAIGNQWYSWNPSRESFASAIAPARTFALAEQIEQLQQAGLIKGGSLENALVCNRQGWLNPPLRFPNEPVRHKLLDLLGDLSLLGSLPIAHFLAYKASHKLHVQLVKALSDSG